MAERRQLSKLSGVSIAVLRQVAGGYRGNGQIVIGVVLAQRISEGARQMPRAEFLPELRLGDLSPTCAACRFYQR